jgi:hypothetical protein
MTRNQNEVQESTHIDIDIGYREYVLIMKCNRNTVIEDSVVRLVPYRKEHVFKYNQWMSDPFLQETTESEPLRCECACLTIPFVWITEIRAYNIQIAVNIKYFVKIHYASLALSFSPA